MADEIDLEGARRRATELQDRLQERDTVVEEAEIEGIKQALDRAQARINLAG
jgi:hypothetical protein